MKHKYLAGLAVAGALTVWSTVASFAREPDDLGLSANAQSAISQIIGPTGCATTHSVLPAGFNAAAYAPESVREAVDAAREKVNDAAANGIEKILNSFENWQEASVHEEDQDGTTTAAPEPSYAGIVSDTCAQIAGITIDVSTLVKVTATVGSGDKERDDEGGTESDNHVQRPSTERD
jgi:hypothetical protein